VDEVSVDPTPPIHVLYVEDDDRLARMTVRYLESHGVRVTWASEGKTALSDALRERPDVVLLDVMLPGMSGFDICREIRQRLDTPVIMVTARTEENDRVVGLEGGADDYVTKPFSTRELLARIRAQVRRASGQAGPKSDIVEVGELRLDPKTMSASLGDKSLSLTSYEFSLLRVLAERAGQVLTREKLVDLVRGSAEEAFDRSIDVHVSHLRQKLGDDPRQPRFLKTIRGVGYMLAGPGH
jgi:DNA-binding response OmpR family regulator